MSAALLQAWQKRGLLARLLWPVSRVYAALLCLRRLAYRLSLYRTERLDVPVLVVGNVVVGGAGKTPTVIAVVQHLRQQGWTPGVVSRGHGRQGDACMDLADGATAEDSGDEPLLIARATGAPLVVGRQRVDAGRLLRQRHPEVDIIVCDDGMQHWTLARDVTVVVFDERGTGNGWLLPAGLLREPWPARAWGGGAMVLLRTRRAGTEGNKAIPPLPGAAKSYTALRQLAPQATNHRGQTQALKALGQHPLGAVAGIAQPQVFFDMLRGQGLQLQQALPLPDHADAATLLAALGPGIDWLCTEKDAVKLFPLLADRPGLPVWSVALQQTPEPAFFAALDQALAPLRHQPGVADTAAT